MEVYMPNIEIHGLGWWKARKIRKRIFNQIKDKPYAEEAVVTVFRTWVFDIHGKSQPFIRLSISSLKHVYEIIGLLKPLGMDIEFLKLKQFIPKK